MSIPFKPVSNFKPCFATLYSWFCHNGLALNGHKFEAIILSTNQKLRTYPSPLGISIAGTIIHYLITLKGKSLSIVTSLLAAISQKSVSLLYTTPKLTYPKIRH